MVYLYVDGGGSIASVGEEGAVCLLWLCSFCLEGFPLPLGTLDGLRSFVVALPHVVVFQNIRLL